MKRVLIIEDDSLMSKVFGDALSKAGYSVTVTADAYQGQHAAVSMKPDLITLDLMLPAGNGIDLLRNLHASFQTQSIPIIVITSYKDDEVRKEIEEIGVQGFFYKPFNTDEIVAKIKTILN